MTTFKNKIAQLKATLSQDQPHQHHHETLVLKECTRPNNKQQLSLQQPIIIEKKTVVKSETQNKSAKNSQAELISQATFSFQGARKKVQPWVPVNIPAREKKIDPESISVPVKDSNCNKEIEIQIEKDDKNKDCLKKLFKKVKKLEEQLKESEKERVRLNLELENYRNRSKVCGEHEKIINKLEGEKYKLEVDLDLVRRLLKEREDQIHRLESRVPKEIIKQVVVEKPVEVIVEVPKIVAGPERIVEKLVEVPKYIEVQKKVPVEIIKQVQKEVIKTVQVPVPTIVEKPVYIEKPFYIEKPPIQIQRKVEIPIEVPVEYPVYIDKPVVDEQFLIKMRHLQAELQNALKENALLGAENEELRIRVTQLSQNLEMLRRHNQEKNRQVQILLQNSIDYLPFSPHHQDISSHSVKYSISSNAHPRVI